MDYFLGVNFLDHCANVNGAPRMRTPSRRSGARSCHAPGGGWLHEVRRGLRRTRFWGVFIIAVHRAFVLGLGARHRGIVELSEGNWMCDSASRLLYLLTCACMCMCMTRHARRRRLAQRWPRKPRYIAPHWLPSARGDNYS